MPFRASLLQHMRMHRANGTETHKRCKRHYLDSLVLSSASAAVHGCLGQRCGGSGSRRSFDALAFRGLPGFPRLRALLGLGSTHRPPIRPLDSWHQHLRRGLPVVPTRGSVGQPLAGGFAIGAPTSIEPATDSHDRFAISSNRLSGKQELAARLREAKYVIDPIRLQVGGPGLSDGLDGIAGFGGSIK